jgi:thiol-disulfide isomerase/thioredoxin
MTKNLILALLLVSQTLVAQNSVKGTITGDKILNSVTLYRLHGASQLYVNHTKPVDGTFSLNMQEDAPTGMYRLLYDFQNQGFIDFIYNKENIEFHFNYNNSFESLQFSASEENKRYQNYLKENILFQQKIDSIQFSYFTLIDDVSKQQAVEAYKIALNNYTNVQQQHMLDSKGTLAYHFIKASQKYYAPIIIETPEALLESEKQNYFTYVDFSDEILNKATFLLEKAVSYIFYLNGSDDQNTQQQLYKNAIDDVMQAAGENWFIKSEIGAALLYGFSQYENIEITSYLLENYYKTLPPNYQNAEVLKDMNDVLKLAIGKPIPNISWEENGVTKNLQQLGGAEHYVLVFWSTSCSHCLIEIPQLHKFLQDKSNVHVIAYALENDDLGFKLHTENLHNWTNILGLGKWENPTAVEFGIIATPTYFILDADKKIVAKPYELQELIAFFSN